MMTRTTSSLPAFWCLCLFVVVFHLPTTHAYALKVQQLTPLELLEQAQLVVAVNVVPGTAPWNASVLKVLKSTEGKNVPKQLRFAVFSRTAKDTPNFDANQSQLLFLSSDGSGIYQCLSYGKQAVWPKTQLEWPYLEQHISTFDTAVDAFDSMQSVLEGGAVEEQDERLSNALKRGNLLLRSIATEFLSRYPHASFLRSRAAIANRIQTNDDKIFQPAVSEEPKTQPVLPPPLVQQPAPKKAPEAKPATPNEEPASTSWCVWAVLIVAVLGLLWLLLKRRS